MPFSLTELPQVVITIDVEDWPQSTWDHSPNITPRAAANLERLLEILAEHRHTATMFVLGKFAETFPECVKRIAKEGHEIATHGHGHLQIFHQSPIQFREDVSRTKGYLEDLLGQPVVGYRAPDFSITRQTLWAVEILAELGFRYDSSIFPIRHSRYGIPGWPLRPVRVKLKSGQSIVELPIATLSCAGRCWPVGGGGYHRLLPWSVIKWAIVHNLRRQLPFVAYCHPYEFDANEFSELDVHIPLATRLHQGLGRRGFRAKFESMLASFDSISAARLAMDFQSPDYHSAELQ